MQLLCHPLKKVFVLHYLGRTHQLTGLRGSAFLLECHPKISCHTVVKHSQVLLLFLCFIYDLVYKC